MEEKKKINSKIIIAIIIIVVILLIFFLIKIFSKTDTKNLIAQTIKLPRTNTSEQIVNNKETEKETEKIPYKITSYSFSAIPGYDDVGEQSATDAFKINPEIWYMANFQLEYDTTNEDEAPVSLKLVNTKLVNSPKIGKYDIIATIDGDMGNREDFINKYSFKNGEYEYATDLFGSKLENGYFYLSLGLWIYDTKVYTYPIETATIIGSEGLEDAGFTSDDVRATIATTVEVKTKSGNTYYIPLEIELLNGNFLEGDQLLVNEYFTQDNAINLLKK